MLDYINEFIAKTFTTINIPNIQITDLVEILIISVLMYQITKRIADTRVFTVAKGILIMLLIYGVLIITRLNVLATIFQWFIVLCVVCIVLASQPEIKRIMESTGSKNYIRDFIAWWKKDKNAEETLEFSDKTLNEIVEACEQMSKTKTGALIVFELDTPLKDIIATGIELDAIITKQLLIQIFEKNTPLHDGALVIKHNRIVSATCYLPLSDNININKDLGTRHRAGIGITEQVDCFVLIVSEETGAISYVRNGNIKHKIQIKDLRSTLTKLQHRKDPIKKKHFESVKGLRVRNAWTKLTAVFGGIMVWFVVLNIIDPITTKRISDINVGVINTDIITSAEQTYDILNNDNISVIIKGRRSILDKLNTRNVTATANIEDMSKVCNVPIVVNIDNEYAEYTEVTYQSNDNIKVILDSIAEKVVKVEYEQTGTLKDGNYIREMKADTDTITIKGANSVVSIIDRVVLPVNVSNRTESFEVDVNPIIYDRNGDVISSDKLQLSKDMFKVYTEMLNTKTVKLNINILNVDEKAFRIIKYEAEKDSIVIGSTDNNLDEVKSIDINLDITDDISNITSNKLVKTIDINEYIPENLVVASSSSKLNITFDIETPIEKEIKIDVNNIEVRHIPSKFDCKIKGEEYTVKIKGYKQDLDNVKLKDIKYYIDLESKKDTNGSKQLKIELTDMDENIEVIELPLVNYELVK